MAKAPDPKKTGASERARLARERAKEFNDLRLVIHVGDDEQWPFVVGDVTARQVGELRRATQADEVDPVAVTLHTVSSLPDYPPLDSLVSLLFLAKRQAGMDVSFDDVATGLTMGQAVWVEMPGDDVEVPQGVSFPDPPASSSS